MWSWKFIISHILLNIHVIVDFKNEIMKYLAMACTIFAQFELCMAILSSLLII